jgi:hypothetical protein
MSARRLHLRLRPAARRALALTLAALRGELARRLGRLALIGAALAGAVVVLYQHGDTPAALARPAVATTAPRAAAGRGSATSRANAAQRQLQPGRPADAAAAWYATREHLPPGKVRALQQDVISKRQVRVLVLADRGHGRLDTALVTVRRDAAGSWSVP